MKQPSTALSSSLPRGCSLIRYALVLCFVVLSFYLILPCEGKDCSRGDAGGCGSLLCFGLRDACADPLSFCFPSTQLGFLAQEDVDPKPNSEVSKESSRTGEIIAERLPSRSTAFEMSNGGIVTCSSIGPVRRLPDGLSSNRGNVGEAQLSGSSSLNVEISPPLLDWGANSLYSASLAFLTVANKNNDSVLLVYEPFSTDPQFYALGAEELSLSPGESASVVFVFLPRWLGSSSAHIILQTNFGGFVIQAKGVAAESPYKIEPLVGLDISVNEAISKNLSIFNPFDDALYVEEVTMWMSASESANQSAQVVCGLDGFNLEGALGSYIDKKEWYSMNSDEFRLPRVDIRPHRQWEVPPQNTKAIAEINLLPYLEGNVFGAICMKLRNLTTDRINSIVIPLELEVRGRAAYSDLTGSLLVSFESRAACEEKGSIFSLFLRNDASQLVSILSIEEVTESSKVFQIKYIKGLILFPRSVTQIALIGYSFPTSARSIIHDTTNLNCNLVVETNSSVSPIIKIPCQDFFHACLKYQASTGIVESDGSYVGLTLIQKEETSANSRTGSLGSIMEDSLKMKPKLLKASEADDLILGNWRSHGTMAVISVLKDQEVSFPVVQIGSRFSKWITVHNPSEKPALMQLVMNSEEIISDCKSAEDLSDLTFSSRSPEINSIETRFGFSLADSAITEAFVHPFGKALLGPIVFHPSNWCMWSSSALIRNNLSGLEWLPLRAFGGSHSLVLLDGPEPVWKLEFNLDLPINRNLSSSPLVENAKLSCNKQVMKEIYAKNTGELPLEVKKVKVSGTDCGSDGFMLHFCEGFALAPGESARLLLSYQTDFSAAIVHRDLELAMASGIFVIPMKASVSVNMLTLCRKSFFRTVNWGVSVLVFVAASTLILVFIRIIPHYFLVGTNDCYLKVETSENPLNKSEKPSFLSHSTKTTRSPRAQKKPEAGFVNRYPVTQHGVLDSPKRTEEIHSYDHQKKSTTLSPTTSSDKTNEDPGLIEAPQTNNLTIKVVKEKGRRRKRKAYGVGWAAKFEVSSSHSGNSTPSSPLSPSSSTPKQGWPISPETTVESPFAREPEEPKYQKKDSSENTGEAKVAAAEKRFENKRTPCPREQPSTTPKSAGKAPILPSPTFLAPSSPIAPHARAPGSKLMKENAAKAPENDVAEKKFVYDIWGDHFTGHLLGKPKEVLREAVDASEGDSQSFFAREPQSLMTMPSPQLVTSTPSHEMAPYDVTCLYQMN
ncbi:uncharacterized protein LOC109721486 [Ananas comosus]|uniref:Uncharacterized protein LOC109721486 n=1 Tax=Ananas comosus TaxID=4615 RepID=A0A6P5G7Z7_ANACO|nr:uncharacterized protein LOC109721486 [Ananas comosus]